MRSLFSRESAALKRDGKSKERASCQLCEQEVSVFNLHRLANYVAGPVCYTLIPLISPWLSSCFLLKCMDRIKITYFPCCFSPCTSEGFYGGFHWSDPLKHTGSIDTFLQRPLFLELQGLVSVNDSIGFFFFSLQVIQANII